MGPVALRGVAPRHAELPPKRENWDLRPAVMLLREALRVKGFARRPTVAVAEVHDCFASVVASRSTASAGGARMLPYRPGSSHQASPGF